MIFFSHEQVCTKQGSLSFIRILCVALIVMCYTSKRLRWFHTILGIWYGKLGGGLGMKLLKCAKPSMVNRHVLYQQEIEMIPYNTGYMIRKAGRGLGMKLLKCAKPSMVTCMPCMQLHFHSTLYYEYQQPSLYIYQHENMLNVDRCIWLLRLSYMECHEYSESVVACMACMSPYLAWHI